ncbi:hypothetical protein J3B02_004121, partial [Coemansia erecta]
MADTAISAGDVAAQRREHLPRQQPHLPLRNNATGVAHVPGTGSQTSAPAPAEAAALADKNRADMRPVSYISGRSDHSQLPGMGPHPGAVPVARANSSGETYDRHAMAQAAAHTQARAQIKPSYSQQRTAATAKEHAFNPHGMETTGVGRIEPTADTSSQHGQQSQSRQQEYQQQQQQYQQQQAYRASTSGRRMVGPY